MTNNNGDLDWLNPNTIATKYHTNPITPNRADYYDQYLRTTGDPSAEASINEVTGMEMLEVIEKGIYKTLMTRMDDAKAIWEEEDDEASYGEYKALKDTVELLAAFLREAPRARYSGLKRPADYGRYDGYGRPY